MVQPQSIYFSEGHAHRPLSKGMQCMQGVPTTEPCSTWGSTQVIGPYLSKIVSYSYGPVITFIYNAWLSQVFVKVWTFNSFLVFNISHGVHDM